MKEVVYDIIFAIAVAGIFYFSLSFILGSRMPIVTVVSDSMTPIINRGDLLVTYHPKAFHVGDIVVYRVESFGYPIVHRIIRIEERNGERIYAMKGDNNPSEDPWMVGEANIIGKVVFSLPLLGTPRLFLFRVFGI